MSSQNPRLVTSFNCQMCLDLPSDFTCVTHKFSGMEWSSISRRFQTRLLNLKTFDAIDISMVFFSAVALLSLEVLFKVRTQFPCHM